MSDDKTKVNCRLIARGTTQANTKALGDLQIPDPDSEVGKEIIQESIDAEEKNKNEDQSEDSE